MPGAYIDVKIRLRFDLIFRKFQQQNGGDDNNTFAFFGRFKLVGYSLIFVYFTILFAIAYVCVLAFGDLWSAISLPIPPSETPPTSMV